MTPCLSLWFTLNTPDIKISLVLLLYTILTNLSNLKFGILINVANILLRQYYPICHCTVNSFSKPQSLIAV